LNTVSGFQEISVIQSQEDKGNASNNIVMKWDAIAFRDNKNFSSN